MSELRIEVRENPHGSVVQLSGKAGHWSADALQVPLQRLLALRPSRVVFDLAQVDEISSMVLGVIIGFRRGLSRHGGRVCLVALQPPVLDVLQVAGVVALFEIATSVEEALLAS